MPELWREQEYGNSTEVKLLKAVDRLLPFMHNIASEGKTWKNLSVKKSQVAAAHAFIEADFPELHQWLKQQLEFGASNGWVIDQ